MSWIVSPRQFVEAFDHVVTNRQSHLLELWSDVKGYSTLFLQGPESVLQEVANRLEVEHWGREFLSIDAAFRPQDESGRVSVVIEHENAVATAVHEIYKLAHVSVPLRVLITYPSKLDEDQVVYAATAKSLTTLGLTRAVNCW